MSAVDGLAGTGVSAGLGANVRTADGGAVAGAAIGVGGGGAAEGGVRVGLTVIVEQPRTIGSRTTGSGIAGQRICCSVCNNAPPAGVVVVAILRAPRRQTCWSAPNRLGQMSLYSQRPQRHISGVAVKSPERMRRAFSRTVNRKASSCSGVRVVLTAWSISVK